MHVPNAQHAETDSRPSVRPAVTAVAHDTSRSPVEVSSAPPCIPRAEIEQVPLFQSVDLDAVWHLVAQCSVQRLTRGHVLIAATETSRDVYVLLDGLLEVHVGDARTSVACIEPGQAVGEVAVINRQPRSATVVAAAPSRALKLPEDVFLALLERSHAFSLNVLSTVCDRLRAANLTLNESRRMQQHFEREASVDALTGLGNRRWLNDVLPRQMRRNAWKREPLSVLMIDVDHFKRINDEFGHPAGDSLLLGIAQVLRARFRPTDLIGRYGGEEFCVVLPDTPLAGAEAAAERVRIAVAETRFITADGVELPPVTVSIGAGETQRGEAAERLVARADGALYDAKRSGRNCVRRAAPRSE